jgi:putative transposase
LLSEATQAWMKMDYNRARHRKMSSSPVERIAEALDVLRSSPSSESLRDAFRLETKRSQRQSNGTISVEGVRFEIPGRYRHFREVTMRYARWGLGRVDPVDQHSGAILPPIYPLNKSANADGRRAFIKPNGMDMPPDDSRRKDGQLPPLLKKILEDYFATGISPAYLPKTPPSQNGESSCTARNYLLSEA